VEQERFGECLENTLQNSRPTDMLEFGHVITVVAQVTPQRQKKREYTEANELMDRRATIPRRADPTARRAATN
jgi:hypothetical protein